MAAWSSFRVRWRGSFIRGYFGYRGFLFPHHELRLTFMCLERSDDNEFDGWSIVSAFTPPPPDSPNGPLTPLSLVGWETPSATQFHLSIASPLPPSGASLKLSSKHTHRYFYSFVTSDMGWKFCCKKAIFGEAFFYWWNLPRKTR